MVNTDRLSCQNMRKSLLLIIIISGYKLILPPSKLRNIVQVEDKCRGQVHGFSLEDFDLNFICISPLFFRQDTVPILDMSQKDLKKRIDCK